VRLIANMIIVLLLICTSMLNSGLEPRTEFFVLDHKFPDRLENSGYWSTIMFVQSLFKKYAQAGLSKESDREIAISGLLQRMQHALKSECRYGIFECLLSRLLLWRVSGNVDGRTVYAGTVDHQLPSWSWMTRNRIEFFPDEKIRILERGGIRFGSGRELFAQIRRLQNCKIKQRGSQHVIKDNDNHDVGELWFDRPASTAAGDCVVVGMQDPDNCLILLVSKAYDYHHRRVGAGQIKACCLSKDPWEGTIV